MDLLLLCGGRATRLGPLAASRPKVLMDVHGRPFLDYLLGFYMPHVDRVFLLAGHLAEALDPFASDRVQVVTEPCRLDTGGAVLNVLDRVSDRFLVANGDTLFAGLDLSAFLAAAADVPALAAVVYGPTAGRGHVEVAAGRAVRFVEKQGPLEGYTYAGLAAFQAPVLAPFPRGAASLERDVLPRLAADGLLGAWPFEGRLHDIGTPEGLEVYRGVCDALPRA